MKGTTRPGQIRIGFLAQENIAVPSPVPGASISRVIYELARELAPRYDLTIASLPHPTIPEGMHEGIRYLRVPAGLDRRRHRVYSETVRVLRRLDLPHRELQGLARYSRRYAVEGLRRLAEYDPHIVHLQNVSQFVPLARRIMPNAKLVLHMHAIWLTELSRRTLLPRLREADLILGVSEYITNGVRRAFPEIADRCRCLHNGVELEEFVPRAALDAQGLAGVVALREQWGATGPVVFAASTWTPQKGTDVLVTAFRRVLSDVPEATLVLAGAFGRHFQVVAPHGRSARAAARKKQKQFPEIVRRLASDLGDRVVFAGSTSHDELPLYYAAADVYAIPSVWQEPFSLTILEAMATSLPVVGSRSGGIPEIVEGGVNGRIVPIGDPEALADAIIPLCKDLDLARRMGAHGRSLVAESFSWRKQADVLAGFYADLLAGSAAEASLAIV